MQDNAITCARSNCIQLIIIILIFFFQSYFDFFLSKTFFFVLLVSIPIIPTTPRSLKKKQTLCPVLNCNPHSAIKEQENNRPWRSPDIRWTYLGVSCLHFFSILLCLLPPLLLLYLRSKEEGSILFYSCVCMSACLSITNLCRIFLIILNRRCLKF